MLTIRLSRIGKKKQPVYRFVLQEKGRDPWGPPLEILGHFNPRSNPPALVIKAERVKHWISKGATTSDTVNNLLINHKIIEGEKRRIVSISRKRQAAMAETKVKHEDDQKKPTESVQGGSASDVKIEAEQAKKTEAAATKSEEKAGNKPVEAHAPESVAEAPAAE